MERFPEKLKQARKNAGLNQTRLALAAGVTRRTITLYETGVVVPRSATIRKLAQTLNVTVEYLTNDAVDDPAANRSPEDRLNTEPEDTRSRAMKEMEELLQLVIRFFADDAIDQDTKDIFFEEAVMAYLDFLRRAREQRKQKKAREEGSAHDSV